MNGFPLSPKISTNFLIFSHPGKLAPLSRSRCPSLFLAERPRTHPSLKPSTATLSPEKKRMGQGWKFFCWERPLKQKHIRYPRKNGWYTFQVRLKCISFFLGEVSPSFSDWVELLFEGGVVLERFVFLPDLVAVQGSSWDFSFDFSGSAQWQSPQSSKNLAAFNKLIGGDEWSIRMDNFPLMVGWDDSLRPLFGGYCY